MIYDKETLIAIRMREMEVGRVLALLARDYQNVGNIRGEMWARNTLAFLNNETDAAKQARQIGATKP